MPQNQRLFQTPLLVMVSDHMGKISFIHEDMGKFLYYPLRECLGMKMTDVVSDIKKAGLVCAVVEQEQEIIFTFHGETFCLSYQNMVIGKGEKGTIALLQSGGDVEYQAVRRFASILNSGICILKNTDPVTVISANEACYQVCGYTSEQFAAEKNNSPATLIYPEDHRAVRAKLARCRAAGEQYVNFEMRCYCRDGSTVWVEVKSTLLRERDADVMVCLIWDITEKKRLEQEIILNVERYKIALSKSRNIIWEYHMDEDWASIENTPGSPYGKTKIIKNFSRLTFDDGSVDREYLPAYRQMFEALWAGKTAASALLRGRRADGSECWYRITHTVLPDRGQGGNIAIGVAEDVSQERQDRKRYELEEKYRQALVGGALASYEIDIDDDRILDKNNKNTENMLATVGLSVNCSYIEFLNRWAATNVDPEDRAMFINGLHPEYLRKQYESGRQEVVCEYRSAIASGKVVWCNATLYLIVSDGHLSGFVYVRDIEEKRRKELELLRKSRLDPLTSLFNRAACLEAVDQLLADSSGGKGALLMIDVDNFKEVNDTFGHMYGDKILAGVAYKLSTIFDSSAVLGRLGGDEFIAFMPDIPDDSAACEKAQIIARELQSVHQEDGKHVTISNSIGIAFYPRHGRKFHELYVKADTALRYAKQAGKSCYSVFGSKISEVVPLQYVNREWLLDELEEVVYISDIQDYTLLYMNQAGRRFTGLKMEDFEQYKCYKVLQGRNTPCPFCTNAKLKKDEFYVWEFENPYYNKSFIVKDKLVDWNGRLVRMEIAVDVGGHIRGNTNEFPKYRLETVMLDSLRILNSAESLEEAIDKTLQLIAEFYDGERAYIVEIDRERGLASNTYEWCRPDVPSQKRGLQEVNLETIPYIYETFNKKQHLVIAGTEELKTMYPSEYRYLAGRGAISLFAVPFEDESAVCGYIGVDNPNINQDTVKVLDSIAYNIANEIKKRRLYQRLEYEASHDPLSGLFNRGSFLAYQEELKLRRDVSCGVVTADINGLKSLNRNYGHAKGDETILTTAGIMTDCFPDSRIFRLSGDEFVIVVLDLEYDDFMKHVTGMSRQLDTETPNGVALGCTWVNQLTDFETLLHHAEELMLVNKQIYYKVSDDVRKHYSPESTKKLLDDMRNGYYKIYLQPKLNSITGQVQSAEALVRYRDPGEEIKAPGKFIPLLEKVKLIRYLDFYMLEEVLKLLSKWKKEGRELIPVSVNFSRITLLESDLLQKLTEIQSRYDIPYELVMIEITESIGDIEHKVIEAIGQRLQKAGFKISLDDFGSDYANMSILSIIHFDEVKLDKSLIDNLVESETNQTVVKCIVGMCKSLNVECVAEGVETREQLELLKSFGCTTIQGYYFSKPVKADEFEPKKTY